jgi:hypothetical protein
MLSFNIHDGFLEAIVRGNRSGLLTAADYNNLCQCENLDDIKMHLTATEYGPYLQNGEIPGLLVIGVGATVVRCDARSAAARASLSRSRPRELRSRIGDFGVVRLAGTIPDIGLRALFCALCYVWRS